MAVSVSRVVPEIVCVWGAVLLILHHQGCCVTALNDGNDLNFTQPEQEALEKLKPEVADLLTEDYMKTDFYLIRFLREANLDVNRTIDLLNGTMIWRKANNMSQILDEDWTDMKKEYPISLDSRDKENRPVIQVEMGKWNIRNGVYYGDYDRFVRYLRYVLEKTLFEVIRAREEGHQNVTRVISLIDANGLGLRQHLCVSCIPLITRWISTMESHYPGFFDEIIVINTSGIGPYALSIVWPFMSSESRRILKTFNYRKTDEYLAYLNERVDIDQRIPAFGGTKVPPAHIFSNFVYLHPVYVSVPLNLFPQHVEYPQPPRQQYRPQYQQPQQELYSHPQFQLQHYELPPPKYHLPKFHPVKYQIQQPLYHDPPFHGMEHPPRYEYPQFW